MQIDISKIIINTNSLITKQIIRDEYFVFIIQTSYINYI